jgi:hypothetical protein
MMKRKTTPVRNRKFTIRLSPEEYERLEKDFQSTTCRKLSEYVRDLVLKKPVTVFTRNQSLDEFLTFAVALKNELNACGKNFNQAVRKLQQLHDAGALKESLEFYQAEQFSLLQKTEEIRSILIKIYQS